MTSINDGQVRRDEDGKIRMVMAHYGSGCRKLVGYFGFDRGPVLIPLGAGSATEPTPVATLVDFAEVREYLPESTPEFSADERRAQIGKRHRGWPDGSGASLDRRDYRVHHPAGRIQQRCIQQRCTTGCFGDRSESGPQ